MSVSRSIESKTSSSSSGCGGKLRPSDCGGDDDGCGEDFGDFLEFAIIFVEV